MKDAGELKEAWRRKKEPQYEDLVNSHILHITAEKTKIETKKNGKKEKNIGK